MAAKLAIQTSFLLVDGYKVFLNLTDT